MPNERKNEKESATMNGVQRLHQNKGALETKTYQTTRKGKDKQITGRRMRIIHWKPIRLAIHRNT